MPPTRALLLLLILPLVAVGCTGRFLIHDPPARPFDAAIVLGCPSESDGSLSRCQMSRALWAAELWHKGYVRYFVTSGGAVHSAYVEAEALAAAMEALGVPADRIYIEPNALHTDENVYYSAQIADALGLRRIAVVSSAGHAAWGCHLLVDWHRTCGAFGMDEAAVRALHRRYPGVLEQVRTPRASPWIGMEEREVQLARADGRWRPSSLWLYPAIGWMRLNGEVWVPPHAPARPPLVTWAARQRLFARQP